MVDFDKVMQALSDGSHRQVLVDHRDEERIDSFSGDGDERNRAVPVGHAHLPLLAGTDLVAWSPETGIVPDDSSPEMGQTC